MRIRRWVLAPASCVLLLSSVAALAEEAAPDAPDSLIEKSMTLFDSGRLLATGGVSQLEGAGGGGLASWALISGYGTRDAAGIDAHFTYVGVGQYGLWSEGAAVGLFDRVELSYAHLTFDTENVGKVLGLGSGYKIDEDVYGAKLKVIGDAVYDQDSLLPQIALGVQYKQNDRAALLHAIGAGSADGTDFYIAASKLFLAQSVLVDATLRETKANQFGILGFGGDCDDSYTTQFESSAAYLFSRQIAAGFEYRTKPDNLRIVREDGAWDVFAAWFLNKNLSLTAAYVDLGTVAIEQHQRGIYVSLQAGL